MQTVAYTANVNLEQPKGFLAVLEGKRTYIVAGLGAIVVGLWLANIIDNNMADKLLALLGFGGLAALRAAKK